MLCYQDGGQIEFTSTTLEWEEETGVSIAFLW